MFAQQIVACACALVIGLAGIAGTSIAQARDLAIGITQFPSNLHPNIDSMAAKAYVLGFTHRPITAYDQDWELVCILCDELPTFENGGAVRETAPDGGEGVAVTYTISEDAVWGDGTPVSVEDVLFTHEVGSHPQAGVTNAELYRRIWKIETEGPRTFTLHITKLTYSYNAINDFRLIPAHIDRPVFEADPSTYRNTTLFDTDPANPGLALGPYRIERVLPGSAVVLALNPAYRGARPAFERITIKAIENTAALEANLLSGEIDMIEGALGLSLDQAIAFEKRHGERFRVHYQPGLIYEHIDLMLDNPILADGGVRQALLHGIDREAISARLFQGRQPVADTNVHPLDWVHDPDAGHYAFDPERAAALLDEAGWIRGADGLRRNEAGEPLSLVLMTTAGNRTRELVQQVLQSQWRELGIEITIKNEPPRVFFGETTSKRAFTGLAMFAWISSPENVPRSTLHSTEIPSEDNGWSGQNFTGYRSERMDALIDAIELELDRDARKGLWRELQQLYARDLPALPLYFRADAHVWPRWLEGVRPTGHQAPTSMWVEEWTVAP